MYHSNNVPRDKDFHKPWVLSQFLVSHKRFLSCENLVTNLKYNIIIDNWSLKKKNNVYDILIK